MSYNPILHSDRSHEVLIAREETHKEKQQTLDTYRYIYHCLTNVSESETAQTVLHDDAPKGKSTNVYSAVYEAMINGLHGHEGIFKISAKLLEENANMQNILTMQQGEYRYVDIPSDANSGKIAEVQKQNQQIDTEKGKLQGMVAVYRQNATLAMAKINVDVQSENRLASEINGYTEKLNSTAESILQMNKRQ